MVIDKKKYTEILDKSVSRLRQTAVAKKTTKRCQGYLDYFKKEILKTDQNESYEIIGGRYNLVISRPAFVLTMAGILLVAVLLALVIWTKLERIEYKETGNIVNQQSTSGELSEEPFTFTSKDLLQRYDTAFDVFNLTLHKEVNKIIEDCSSNNQMCHIVTLYRHINDNFSCHKQAVGESKLKLPMQTWQDKAGSSEDLSIMFSAMLYGLGYEVNILLTPSEGMCVINNFDEERFLYEVTEKYKKRFSFLKRKTYTLNPHKAHLIDVKEDFRFVPLTLELKSTTPVNIVILHDKYDYGLYQKGESPLIKSEYDVSQTSSYTKDIYIAKGACIAVESNEMPADIIYVGYRKNDNRVIRYIKDAAKIRKNDGSHYFNQTSMLFTLGAEHSIPGREKKYIEDLRSANGLIEIPYEVMAKKFMAERENNNIAVP